jgi:hypothetical protein
MYRDVAQWHQIRRRILGKRAPKKQVSRDTGISRRTINKMLMHENPPRYGPRPPLYPKLGPYIFAIDELIASTPAADLTIRDIVEHLRREHGFAGSYDSVWNYIRRRIHNDDEAWERAYKLIIRLPKARAVDFVRLLSRGSPSILTHARLRTFEREAAGPRKLPIRSVRRRLADTEWMQRVLQKKINDDKLRHELNGIPDVSALLKNLRDGRLQNRNRAMVVLASHHKVPNRTICHALGVGKAFTHFYSTKKNTGEMIRMMDVLIKRYAQHSRLYLSWDAASWHISKDLFVRIEAHNAAVANGGGPLVETAPLPLMSIATTMHPAGRCWVCVPTHCRRRRRRRRWPQSNPRENVTAGLTGRSPGCLRGGSPQHH